MSMDYGALDSWLAAVTVSDESLRNELLQSFLESAYRQVDLLRRSRCDANWHYSALRLRGLAASFDNHKLLELAEKAVESVPGDPAILRELDAELARLSESD